MNEILEEVYPYEGGWARKLKLDLKRDPTIQRKIKDLGGVFNNKAFKNLIGLGS